MFLARRSARFLAAALLSAIFFSTTASSSLVKGRKVGRLLSQSFSDMVHAGPATAMCDWGETGDERCHGLRFPRWLDAAQRSPATHSFASGCMWSMEWSHAPGSHCFPADMRI